jgi:hypothetical protein
MDACDGLKLTVDRPVCMKFEKEDRTILTKNNNDAFVENFGAFLILAMDMWQRESNECKSEGQLFFI